MAVASPENKEKKAEAVSNISPDVVMRNLHNTIGVPENYSHTRGFNVYDNRWRINVYCFANTDIPSLIKRLFIKKSFFLTVDKDGNILTGI